MRLIKILIFSLLFSLLSFNAYSDIITSHEVASDLGTNNSSYLQRIVLKSDNSIWIPYNATGSHIKMAYSSDSGSSWDYDSNTAIHNGDLRHPSLAVDANDSLHFSGTNPGILNVPKYNLRNGSWAGSENVTSSTNISLSQIALDSNAVAWCVFRFAPAGSYTTISANTRAGGSWGTKVDLTLSGSYLALSIAGCMGDSDNMHAIWIADDGSNYSVQTAYFNGASWSSITALDTYAKTSSIAIPVINYVDGDIIATWVRNGVGTYTTKKQLRYAISSSLGSWSAVADATDRDADMDYYVDVGFESDGDYVCVFSSTDIDPNNTSVYHLGYISYNGATWSSITQLTEGANYNKYPTIVTDGQAVHAVWQNEDGKLYYGTFDAPSAIIYSGATIILID